jgi:thiol:disulfide interchange protein DsbC
MFGWIIFFCLSAAFLFPFDPPALHAFGQPGCDQKGCEEDCSICHSLSKQEANDILRQMKISHAEVLKIQLSPVKGLWEVAINDRGTQGMFYIDFSKKFLIPGPIIELKSGRNKTLEEVRQLEKGKKIDFSKIPLASALRMGDARAAHKVVVFTDPECQFCARLHQEMEKVLQQRKDIAFYILLFPLKFHKEAYWKSKSIQCRKSLKLLEEAFARKPIPQPNCETKEIDSNIRLAESLGITGTPTLVLPDGRVHMGTMPAEQLIQFITGKP